MIGELFLPKAVVPIFDIHVLFQYTILLTTYALAGGQAYTDLLNIRYAGPGFQRSVFWSSSTISCYRSAHNLKCLGVTITDVITTPNSPSLVFTVTFSVLYSWLFILIDVFLTNILSWLGHSKNFCCLTHWGWQYSTLTDVALHIMDIIIVTQLFLCAFAASISQFLNVACTL